MNQLRWSKLHNLATKSYHRDVEKKENAQVRHTFQLNHHHPSWKVQRTLCTFAPCRILSARCQFLRNANVRNGWIYSKRVGWKQHTVYLCVVLLNCTQMLRRACKLKYEEGQYVEATLRQKRELNKNWQRVHASRQLFPSFLASIPPFLPSCPSC